MSALFNEMYAPSTLGSIRSRRPSGDGLETRIREAARHVPLERLALPPQCGFATSILGSALTAADELGGDAALAQVGSAWWSGRS